MAPISKIKKIIVISALLLLCSHLFAKKVLVTGGSGFLGSHLCEKLLSMGHKVIALDNLLTSEINNIDVLLFNPPGKLFLRGETRCEQELEDATVMRILPPTLLAYCAAVLKQKGAIPLVRDYYKEGLKEKDFKNDISSLKPKIAVLNGSALNLKDDLKYLELTKNEIPINPVCPTCNKRMKSAGRMQGFRCKGCGTKKSGVENINVERTIQRGMYEVPPGARRHIAKPLIRLAGPGIFPSR